MKPKRFPRAALRLSSCASAVVAAMLIFSPPAQARMAVGISANDLLLNAETDLQRNNIKVTGPLGGTALVQELDSSGPRLTAGTRCTELDPRQVRCVQPFARVLAHLGPFDDQLRTEVGIKVIGFGESGDDRIEGGLADDLLRGGFGNDVVEGGAGTATGNDELSGERGNDTVVGRDGVDQMRGDEGDDLILARDGIGEELIDCGEGSFDRADVDLRDSFARPIGDITPASAIVGCENITVGAVNESANVRIRGRSVRLRRGSIGLRLSCPRSVPEGCGGTLTVQGVKGRRSVDVGTRQYRTIPAGRRRSVSVRLSRRAARRYKRIRVTSVEQGRFGPKTTVATLRLRR